MSLAVLSLPHAVPLSQLHALQAEIGHTLGPSRIIASKIVVTQPLSQDLGMRMLSVWRLEAIELAQRH